MAMIQQGQPPPYSEAQQVITSVIGVPEPNLLALAAAQNTRLPDAVPEEKQVVMTAEHDANLDTFKQKIYRHALFPLLAMVFEKCESATSFPDSTANEFEKDLKACMKCLEGLDKPLMDDDDEINHLMLKAVQVLRIHLMEVEKVNELCKDFCARYISCLKSKLTSESLLHVEGCDSPPPLDCSSSGSLSPGMLVTNSPTTIQLQTSPVSASGLNAATMVGGGVVLQQPQQQQQHQQQQQQPQIVSGNTVYQMVRTPQGIVAQPIQIQGPLTPLATPTPTPQQSAIHGSTPLSQVGLAALASPPALQQQQQQVIQQQQHQSGQMNTGGGGNPLATQQQNNNITLISQNNDGKMHVYGNPLASQQQNNNITLISQNNDGKIHGVPNGSDDVDDEEKNGKQKRGVLPKHATQIMKSWLFQHIVHPYPTEDEKRQIASQTNLTLLQVNNWFINARRRILQPMLEVSNPDKGKAKKTTKPVARPQHRFWPVQASDSSSTSSASAIITNTSPSPSSSSSSHHTTDKKNGHPHHQQTDESASSGHHHHHHHSAGRVGGQIVASAASSMAAANNGIGVGSMIDSSGATTIQSDALVNLMQNSGLVLKVGPDGQLIPTMAGQVSAPPPPPPPPNPGAITLESLQALQSSGLLFAPGPSPLSLSLPFNGLTPSAAVTGAGLGAGLAGFGLAGAFPGLAAAAAAASIMNFNPAAAAAAYAPLSFANLNATPIDLSSAMSSQSAQIQLINGAANATQINQQISPYHLQQLQMQMGLSYPGISTVDQSNEQQDEGGQLHIDIDNNNGSSGMADVGD